MKFTAHHQLIALAMLLTPNLRVQEISIFNGRDLTGWEGLREFWSVKDGAITGKITGKNAPAINTFLVWQGGTVTNFELTCRFKLIPENSEGLANSGIEFRANLTDSTKFTLKGYQGELDPGTLHPKVWPSMENPTGCLTDDPPGMLLCAVGQKVIAHVGEMPGSRMVALMDSLGSLGTSQTAPASYRKRDWNDYRIVALGNHIQIFLNGIQTADALDEGNRFQSGLLGLQLHRGGGAKTLQFKDIKLRVLAGPASTAPSPSSNGNSAAPAPATIQTDPNQPRIAVLKEQGPNAVEWALAPLDQSAPPGIRQNLTELREDLLDEGKQKPKANAGAYTLGSQLCDKILASFTERSQASVNAGYTAAQANADMRVDSQSLRTNRNYLMSWPQYAREKDERSEIQRQQLSGADLKKERSKVDWSNRSNILRKYLDDLYRQFREAMR